MVFVFPHVPRNSATRSRILQNCCGHRHTKMHPAAPLILGLTGALAASAVTPGVTFDSVSCTNPQLNPDVHWIVTLHQDDKCRGSCIDLWAHGDVVCTNTSTYEPWDFTTWNVPQGHTSKCNLVLSPGWLEQTVRPGILGRKVSDSFCCSKPGTPGPLVRR